MPVPIEQRCPHAKKCGGCQLQNLTYPEQLAMKHRVCIGLLGRYGRVAPVLGMADPTHYRAKVQAAFGVQRGRAVCGIYQSATHNIVPVDECRIEDAACDGVVRSVRKILTEMRLPAFDERRGTGLLRHVLVRRAFGTGEMLVVLVTAAPIFPARQKFVAKLLEAHPEITTVVQNVNGKFTPMVLGDEERVLFGPGFITETLCGLRFRISARSFFQVNPVQTEVLYRTALDFAHLTGAETVVDAYCGTGTIGLAAAGRAKEVLGVELNPDAVRDARQNAKENGIRNARFVCGDSTAFLGALAQERGRCDVLFLDPPRAGSTPQFLKAAAKLAPERIVYISCNPETLARDLKLLVERGYRAEKIQPVDMFPFTKHIECVVGMVKKKTDAGRAADANKNT